MLCHALGQRASQRVLLHAVGGGCGGACVCGGGVCDNFSQKCMRGRVG